MYYSHLKCRTNAAVVYNRNQLSFRILSCIYDSKKTLFSMIENQRVYNFELRIFPVFPVFPAGTCRDHSSIKTQQH